MSRQEVMTTRVGEMQDMIACLSIFNGAEPKPESREMSFAQLLEVE